MHAAVPIHELHSRTIGSVAFLDFAHLRPSYERRHERLDALNIFGKRDLNRVNYLALSVSRAAPCLDFPQRETFSRIVRTNKHGYGGWLKLQRFGSWCR